jgi:hypothetical protein
VNENNAIGSLSMNRISIFELAETGAFLIHCNNRYTTAANISFGKPCPDMGIIKEEA